MTTAQGKPNRNGRRRGSIIRRSESSWSVVVPTGLDPTTGKYKQQWVTIKGTKKDAEQRLTELLHQLDTGTFVKPSSSSTGEFLLQWLRDYAKPSLAPKTFQVYEHIVNRHLIPSLGAISLTQLSPRHLQSYYADKMENGRRDGKGGLSPRTVRHHHRTIHDALQHAVRWGLVLRNVAQAVDPPRFSNKEMMTLDQSSVQGFLEVARGSEYFPLFHLLLFTGMRRSEALGLHWRNIDLDLLTLSVVQVMHQMKAGEVIFREPKSARSRRLVDLTPSSGVVLREWKAYQEEMFGRSITSNDLVFSLQDGSPMLPDSVTHAFTKMVRAHGFKGLRLHDLRHSHATLMLQQGIHPKIVQERLGHSSIQVTLDIYSHVAPGMQKAAALRFEEGLIGSTPDTKEPALQTLH